MTERRTSKVTGLHITLPIGSVLAFYASLWSGLVPLPERAMASASVELERRVERIATKVEWIERRLERMENRMDRFATRQRAEDATPLGQEGG